MQVLKYKCPGPNFPILDNVNPEFSGLRLHLWMVHIGTFLTCWFSKEVGLTDTFENFDTSFKYLNTFIIWALDS